jgi:parallel beta-helix repeat protein
MKRTILFCLIIFTAVFLIAQNTMAATPQTYWVNSNNDIGANTLRQAILDANTNVGATDTIRVYLPTNDTIKINSVLMISDPVIIIGTNTPNATASGTLVVGSGRFLHDGFDIMFGSGTQIENMAIMNCNRAIHISSSSNVIRGCWLGTDWNDSTSVTGYPGSTGNQIGVYIESGTSGNQIGDSGSPNIISDNSGTGIYATTSSTITIANNYIGTNCAGTAASAGFIQLYGIHLYNCSNCTLGDSLINDWNVISNCTVAVRLQGTLCANNTMRGNSIGTNANQNSAIMNEDIGILLEDGANNNAIGQPIANRGNLICRSGDFDDDGSGEENAGLLMTGSPAPNANKIQNNLIGLGASNGIMANYIDNIFIENGDNNIIGGFRDLNEGNVISTSYESGVEIMSGTGNIISGNYIGTNVAGTSALGNDFGVLIHSSGNVVGVTTTSTNTQRNVISGNDSQGVDIYGGVGNVVAGNYVGLAADGSTPLGNGDNGIILANSSTGTIVGGTNANLRNVIAANTGYGIDVNDSDSNTIVGNYLDCNAAGNSTSASLRNVQSLRISASDGHYIANNHFCYTMSIENADGTTVVGNTLGLLPDGSEINLPATTDIITIQGTSNQNSIGVSGGQGNLIHNATGDGILVTGASAIYNGLYGNTITAFGGEGISLASGGNGSKAIPVITGAFGGGILGTSGPNNYIEVFVAENNPGGYGGSLRYVNSTTANGTGSWGIGPGGYFIGEYVVALASDGNKNTSEFSLNAQVVDATPTYTPTITLTNTPTNSPTYTSTPTFTSTHTPTFTPTYTTTLTRTTTPTCTITPSITLTSTESATLTATRTITLTTTPTPTRTVTGSITPTSTVTVSVSPTYTATPLPTETATPTNTPTNTATPTSTVVITEIEIITPAYPNPAKDFIYFLLAANGEGRATIAVYNITGERVAQILERVVPGTNRVTWDCRDISSGMYYVVVDGYKVKKKKFKIAIQK